MLRSETLHGFHTVIQLYRSPIEVYHNYILKSAADDWCVFIAKVRDNDEICDMMLSMKFIPAAIAIIVTLQIFCHPSAAKGKVTEAY